MSHNLSSKNSFLTEEDIESMILSNIAFFSVKEDILEIWLKLISKALKSSWEQRL